MSLSVEESNFLRFYFLNLKIASKAVRIYFDAVHPPSGLANELANCSGTLKGLRFITKSQLKILYPNPACNVRSEDFDTTLMVCLLRNMTPYECAPRTTGWDNLPLQGDASTGADLARVKWYRNMLAHHEDGKLSSVDFSQYWTDLESAILHLGGPSLHQESQSAQHIVLDKSLTDMLNTVRSCEKDILNLQMSHEKHTSMINDLQTTLHKQKLVKEKHETEIQLLQDSLQKVETEANKLATNLSDTNRAISNSNEEIEACKKEIEKNEERIKVLQEQSVNKQNHIDKINVQIDNLHIKYEKEDKLLKEHREQILKHDEQIALNAKDIDDIKKKQHNTDDSSSESRRKRLEDDTKALIEEDLREGTFVATEAAEDGLLLLEQNGVLLITGHAGTGKSRISRHILHMFCTEYTSFKCIKLDKLEEWEAMVNRDDNVVILLDDIFGETNCIYNGEKDIEIILDKVYAYVCKGNIKVVITIRDTVKRQCQEVFDSHRLFKFDFVDLSSDKYRLSWKKKRTILTVYMKTVRQSDLVNDDKFVDHNGITTLESNELTVITYENSMKGFPLAVYQFVHNDKYFQLGSKFFDRPTDAIVEEINNIRRQGEIHEKFKIQYGLMVYTAINKNGIDLDDDSNVIEVVKIIDAIYGETIRMKRCQISDAVNKLKGSYLVKIPNKRSYRYHHPTLQESVILSFAEIDNETKNKIIPLLNWTFFLKMVKPNAYKEKEGEVVLRIPTTSYKLLAYRIVDICMAGFSLFIYDNGLYVFLVTLSNTEIFQQKGCVLLTYLLDAVEKKDREDNYTEKMIRSADSNSYLFYMKNKDAFLTVLLVIVARNERMYEMLQFILQRIKQILRTDNNYFTLDYMKAALITSLYQISLTKTVRSVELVKALFDIVEENKIPVLLDQNITLTNIGLPDIRFPMCNNYNSDTTCVFLSLCMVNAYHQFDIPLLEYLLSRYNETSFNVNLFLKAVYKEGRQVGKSSSNKSLKWMIEKFEDQELIDIDFILKTACHCQMLDTVEYLASKCKKFDAISCLKWCLHLDNLPHFNIQMTNGHDLSRYNKDLFNFLVSKIGNSSTDLTSIVLLLLGKLDVPDYMFDAFLPVCFNNKEILTLACKNAHVYVAKQIIEKSQNVDIQSALSACIAAPCVNHWTKFVLSSNVQHLIEERQFKIGKYIIEKFGYEQFDLKAVCRQSYHNRNFNIIEWLVQNIDVTLLNVDFIRNFALQEGGLDILEYTISMTELSSFEKMKVLKSLTRHFTTECSTKMSEIASAVWDSTDDKDGLKMEEIVISAYKSKCFNLLVWIYENCNSYISTDVRKLLMLACEEGRIKVAKWVLQTFEPKSLDFDGGKLFILACNNLMTFYSTKLEHVENISMVNWALTDLKVKPLDLKSGLLRLICLHRNVSLTFWMNRDNVNEFPKFVVSILEKCFHNHCLSTKDLEEVMKISLDHKLYVIVNWFLEHVSLSSFDEQDILNKACSDAEFETIKILFKYFCSLDKNYAIIYACTSDLNDYSKHEPYKSSTQIVVCLDLLLEETDLESIDINRIVSTVCKQEYISNSVMTWILRNFPHNRIPINEVLISCCEQGKLYHVKYIFHEVDNLQLDINEAFFHACGKRSSGYSSKKYHNIMLADFLFQRLHDKTSSLSIILKELFLENSYDLILYFLKKGYTMAIDMKQLMNQACRHGHVRLVQWILANVQHTKLDIKSADHEACKFINCESNRLQCVVLIRHYTCYIQDIKLLEIGTVLENHY